MDAAPSTSALQLCGCGLSASSSAPRCRACPYQGAGAAPSSAAFAAPAAAFATPSPAFSAPVRPAVPATEYAPLMTYSRWQKSANTFGPAGRVVATLLLLVPLPVFLVAVTIGIGIIGAGVYLLVVVPWALRDIWKRAEIPVQAPVHSPTSRF